MQNGLENVLYKTTIYTVTDGKLLNNYIINTNSIWSHMSGNTRSGYFIPITEQTELEATAIASNDLGIAFLKNKNYSANGTPSFCDGYGRIIYIKAGKTAKYTTPSDCNYLWVNYTFNGNIICPDNIRLTSLKKFLIGTDDTLTHTGMAADAKATGDKINNVFDRITEKENVNINSSIVRTGLINVNNVWSSTSGFYSYALSITKNDYQISITANENNASIVGLLKNGILANNTIPPYCNGITNRIIIPARTTMNINIPSDCTYIVIIKEASAVNYTPESITISRIIIDSSQSIPINLHEMPASESVLNIVKRCRQMTDIKWTPAVDLPRYMLVQRGGAVIPDSANTQNYLGTFKAGTEYTGIPYGRVNVTMKDYNYQYATGGHYIDFKTFISSVFNPKSKLCTENVGSVSGHRSVIYATVCSGLTCYALDVPEVPTASIANIPGMSFIGKLNNNGTLLSDSLIRIGDVLNKYDYHTAIITDIIRDNEGIIQIVELSDASTAGLADRNYADGQMGGICRRKGWTRESLFGISSWGDYNLYRYTGDVSYTPSKYVNVGDEFNMHRIEHFPIMPYEGDGFKFKDGYIPNNAVHLIITLDGYKYAKVFKDGIEITGSPFTVVKDEQNEIIPIDITEIGVGSYSAYLCNISDGNVTNMTYACTWTIE